jgi:3-hydroxybutyryl-CoA dehydrogenase
VQRDVLPDLNNEARPAQFLEDLVRCGHLGYKTGGGFYDWKVKDMQALAARRDRFIIETLDTLAFMAAKHGTESKRPVAT